ncbi:MAG: LacI family transcriptional regulator [Oscillospiraceae bacterium]|jgi:LacI family transcriptional regulator|nr:LacI family transcriptional regulator [Oscillospiraceae bacterium]
MGIKVKDLAKMLGVSPATVSLALNNKAGISQATRQRIFDKLSELGYSDRIPIPAAENPLNIRLVIYKKHGLVVSDTHFFSQVIEGINLAARRYGYNLLVTYLTGQDSREEQRRLASLAPCSGVILLATELEAGDLSPFLELDIPIVLLDSYFETVDADCIVINNAQGAAEAVRHLLEKGHREIGYLHSSAHINNFRERREGMESALHAAGLELTEKMIFPVEPSVEGARRSLAKLLEAPDRLPTAFFADNDLIAIGAAQAFRDVGLRIPEDISLIGFDDMPIAEIMEPPLSTIHVPKQRLGMLAVYRLVSCINGETDESVKIEVRTRLTARGSVSSRRGIGGE